MKSSSRALLLLAAVAAGGGCVLRSTYYQKVEETADTYRELEGVQKKLEEVTGQKKTLEDQLAEAKKQLDAFERGTPMDEGKGGAGEAEAQKIREDLARARGEIERLQGELARTQGEADRLRALAEELKARPREKEIVRVETPAPRPAEPAPPPRRTNNGPPVDLKPLQGEIARIRKAQEEEAEEARTLRALVEEALKRPAPAPAPATVERIVETRTVEVPAPGVTVRESPDRIEVTLAGSVVFDSGRWALTPEAQAALRALAPQMREIRDRVVWVVGHTDSVEIKETYREKLPTNWELSMTRAVAVARFLEESLGIEPGRIYPTGGGKNHPLASNQTEEGRSRNRRVEILIVPRDASLFP